MQTIGECGDGMTGRGGGHEPGPRARQALLTWGRGEFTSTGPLGSRHSDASQLASIRTFREPTCTKDPYSASQEWGGASMFTGRPANHRSNAHRSKALGGGGGEGRQQVTHAPAGAHHQGAVAAASRAVKGDLAGDAVNGGLRGRDIRWEGRTQACTVTAGPSTRAGRLQRIPSGSWQRVSRSTPTPTTPGRRRRLHRYDDAWLQGK